MPAKYRSLFRSGRIGNVQLKNRFVMAPMGDGLVGFMGTFSERAIDYYERRAMGGVGLIITGQCLVNSEIEPWEIDGEPALITFNNAMKIRNFIKLTERIHDQGAKIFVQLTAGFGRVYPPIMLQISKGQPIAPTSQPLYWNPEITARELTRQEINTLIDSFGKAAAIAKTSGFDGIELHGHEGYLMDQFTTALWNKRKDEFGGDLQGRMTFILKIIQKIQETVGTDYPIIYRYAIEHKIEGGRKAAESIEMAKMLEAAGVAALHVDAGCYDNWHWPHPPIYQPPGCMIDMAEAVKPHVNIPVITVGRLGYPELANSVLEAGKADYVALGRPLLADPDFVDKTRLGNESKIRPCVGCHVCLGRILKIQSLSCAVNPQCGDEVRLAITPAPQSKRVLVIGGGVGGMEAARVTALRGHQVALYEKDAELGGMLRVAGAPDFKSDILRLLKFKKGELAELDNVEIHLNEEVTAETIQEINPDVVFVATGSRCLTADDIGIKTTPDTEIYNQNEILQPTVPAGKSVVVIGGGSVGCEVGLHLADHGKEVTILEQKSVLSEDLQEANREMLLDLAESRQINIMLNTDAVSVSAKFVSAARAGESYTYEADIIVLAVGSKPENHLVEVAESLVDHVYLIGDCVTPRSIKEATWEAFKQARLV